MPELTTKEKLDAIEQSNLQLLFDGCHKIYVVENQKDLDDALTWGWERADLEPAARVREIIRDSCPLVFVHCWSLREDFPWDLGQETEDIFDA